LFDFFLKKTFIFTFLLFSAAAYPNENPASSKCYAWFKPNCERISQIWNKGSVDYFLSLYAWHNRYYYDPARIQTYNELAIGAGLGKTFLDEKKNLHGLYAFAFLESHSKLEPVAGYGYLKAFPINNNIIPGIGYTAFITARPDINKGIPFPGILPLAGLSINKLTLFATYIPGHQNVGNVLFIFLKYKLSDQL